MPATIPEMSPVISSNIKAIGHDGTDLFVTFRSGATYRYPGVSAHLAERIKTADSPGRCFIDNVRNQNKAGRVE